MKSQAVLFTFWSVAVQKKPPKAAKDLKNSNNELSKTVGYCVLKTDFEIFY